jgi:hypothetical protein
MGIDSMNQAYAEIDSLRSQLIDSEKSRKKVLWAAVRAAEDLKRTRSHTLGNLLIGKELKRIRLSLEAFRDQFVASC